ncbi:MucBP domain-containing protein [Candidatus Uhrbacteria bacterium]|nr:MucBP domain-containing protein [Candidatus Uhrbacteria bacterium]
MNKNFLKWLALPAMLALLGQGCGRPAPAPGTTGSGAGGAGTVAGGTRGGSNDCFNAYYPLNAGSSITYKSVSGDQVVPFTISVLEHDADSIVLEYTFTVEGREAKITNELACENGTIRGKGHFDFAQAFLGIDIRYEVLRMEGEIMPADVRVGSEWTMENEVKMITSDTSPIGRLMNGRVATTKIVSKVVGEESVTVPAGTFRALKIEQTVTSGGEISGRPYSTTAENFAWYVKDVGLVKSQSTATGGAFTMEAQTITR